MRLNPRRLRPLVVTALCATALASGGCGGPATDAPTGPGPGGFAHAPVRGMPPPVAMAVAGGEVLFLIGGDARRVYATARPGPGPGPGAALKARPVELGLRAGAPVSGGDALALQGYSAGHLWELPVDLVALAVQEPNLFFLGDRRLRVVYWGRFTRDAAGRIQRLHVDYAFSAPGADRAGARGGDWEDKGPGLAALLAVHEAGQTEDLLLAERGREGGAGFKVWRLDRYGTPLGRFEVRGAGREPPVVLALGADAGRFLVLLGPAGAALAPFLDPGARREAPLGAPAPTAPLEGAAWRALAVAPDGTLYLAGDRSGAAVLAWRTP